jgi:hypothetical protein
MPGPAPKPDGQRRRRNAPLANTTRLPAEGRRGSPPKWPLSGRQGETGKALWAQLWATPQAVAWERLGWTRVVARYVRCLLVAERVEAPVALLGEVRQLEDRLGLSPISMLRLRWEIAPDEVAEQREQTSASAAEDLRARLRAVE